MNICSGHKNRRFQENIPGRVRVTLQVFICIPATAVLLDLSLTVKAAPHEYEIRFSQP